MFLWPALLSSVRVEQDRGETQESDTPTAAVASLLGSGQLVVRPTEVDEEEKVEPTRPVSGFKAQRPPYR